jgi:hypothetical protein
MGRRPIFKKSMTSTQLQRRWRAKVKAKAEAAKFAPYREARARRYADAAASGNFDLRVGRAQDVFKDFAEPTAALITDPPYAKEADALWELLAEVADRSPIPGGSLIAYCGHDFVPRAHDIFRAAGLTWHWPLVLMHHTRQDFPGKFVYPNHKPILWYTKGLRRSDLRPKLGDVLQSDESGLAPEERNLLERKKELEWTLGEAGATHLICQLTKDTKEGELGELIVDPFAGIALWGLIASRKGRRWIGADIAEDGSVRIVV